MGTEQSGQRLAGKRVLLVGGGAQDIPGDGDPPIGIGQAMAVSAAREGADLLLADIDPAAAQRTVARVRSFGKTATVVEADVASVDDCERIISSAIETFREIDGMVLNVGVPAKGAGRGLAGITAEEWDRVFAINVRAGFLLCRAAFAHGLADNASIVFTSSIAALKPFTNDPAYSASKSALVGLSGHVAMEGAPRGIRSNIVVPGNIDTPLRRIAQPLRAQDQDIALSRMSLSPIGRQGTGWDIAYATTYLLSDEAAYVTAQVLAVDGGVTSIGLR